MGILFYNSIMDKKINVLDSGVILDLAFEDLYKEWGAYQTPKNDTFYLIDKRHGYSYTFIRTFNVTKKETSYTVLLPSNNTIPFGFGNEGVKQMGVFITAMI